MNLHAVLQQLEESQSRLERMLLQLKWPPPGHLPAKLMDRIALAFETGVLMPPQVEELFVRFYTAERLNELLDEWRARRHFPHRMPILEEAVTAHYEGRFRVSVPTLLPQLEGAIVDVFGHRGRIREKDLRRYLDIGFDGGSRFDRLAAAFFLQVLLDRFEWGDPVPILSRHAILHGADVEYGTPANSLRLILTFAQIQDTLRYVAPVRGRRFHAPVCSRLQATTDRRIFREWSHARDEGFTPCGVCLRHLSADW